MKFRWFDCCRIILMAAMAAGILFISGQDINRMPDGYGEYTPVLQTNENLIDYTKDDGLVYALVEQTGLSEYHDLLVVYEQSGENEWERIYTNDFTGLKPWKLAAADIDRCGEKEVLIAVCKSTHFDDMEKNRLFVFNFDGRKLYKKWTGSQIAGTWNDFAAGDLLQIPGSELIFVEQTGDGKERISIFYWLGFGFTFLAASDSFDNIEDIDILGDNRMQITCKLNQREEVIILNVKNGKITKEGLKP